MEQGITNSILDSATAAESSAKRQAQTYMVVAASAVIVAIGLAMLLARSVVGPLRRLTRSAYELSEERLPQLVDQLTKPDSDAANFTLEPIEVRSHDEIGQLAKAFNNLQEVTSNVAGQQSQLLRKGIGDIFVNLARRNQSLLDRQIEFIDQLEANEDDPDQLENLFKLDHLATRMRRNAESLLVLAGAEPPRRRGRPVDMADVVRVAIGEVEHFSRITLLALDEATVAGNVAVDLAHLMSELMENATQFSPPETSVEIVGHLTREGTYVLSVSDQGIGMSAEQMNDANRVMASPPVLGLALSRSLGFTVIGRLAQRFGITVRMMSSPAGGASALVTVPGNARTTWRTSSDAPRHSGCVSMGRRPHADDDTVEVERTAVRDRRAIHERSHWPVDTSLAGRGAAALRADGPAWHHRSHRNRWPPQPPAPTRPAARRPTAGHTTGPTPPAPTSRRLAALPQARHCRPAVAPTSARRARNAAREQGLPRARAPRVGGIAGRARRAGPAQSQSRNPDSVEQRFRGQPRRRRHDAFT